MPDQSPSYTYGGDNETASDPIDNLVAANAHATDPLTNGNCRAFLCTVAGNLVCRCAGGSADITIAIAAGWHPLRLSHVRATSTATIFVGY